MKLEEPQSPTNSFQQNKKKLYQGNESVDLQYQICSTFLKNTGQKLNKNELRAMTQSNKLIDALLESKNIPKENEKLEETSTTSTGSRIQYQSRNFMSINSDNIQSRLISRKSPKGNIKYLSQAFVDEMKDIEENCGSRTIKSIKALIDEHKKLQDAYAEMEIREKKYIRRLDKLDKEHEGYLILRKVEEQNQKKIQKLQAQIYQLENKSLNTSQELEQIKEVSPPLVDPRILSSLTSFLNEKEKSIEQKMKRVQGIQDSILEVVKNQIREIGCAKCCTFLKKIKEWMLKLRISLQQQTEDIEKIYNRYKTIFCFTHA